MRRSARTLASSHKLQSRSAVSRRGELPLDDGCRSTLAHHLTNSGYGREGSKYGMSDCKLTAVPDFGLPWSNPFLDRRNHKGDLHGRPGYFIVVYSEQTKPSIQRLYNSNTMACLDYTVTVWEILFVQSGIAAIEDSDHTGTLGACLPGFGRGFSSGSRKIS